MAGLGRRVPSDWAHVEKHPLKLYELTAPAPVVLGINWYSNFDSPQKDSSGVYWIGKGDLGYIRGGHAICARPYPVVDNTAWWDFYDQGNSDACVGFSCQRMMTLLNRARYDAPWLYHEAQLVDEYSDTPPAGGTSVRAGCDVLRLQGNRKMTSNWEAPSPVLKGGIKSNTWATDWDSVRNALGLPSGNDGVPLLNSWGRSYPHVVRLTDEAGTRLLDEQGEAAVVVDR